jgi:hypothetical protein
VYETKDLTYVHIPKTGGQFVSRVLRDIYPSFKALKYHQPLGDYKPDNAIISCVRNPFDWYVSCYFYYLERDTPLTRGLHGFENTIKTLLLLGFNDRISEIEPINWNCKAFEYEELLEYPTDGKLGYYSWLFNRMIGTREDIQFMRTETLTDNLISILKDKSKLTSKDERVIRSIPPRNTTVHDHYRTYYSDELIELVYEKDKIIFDRFGYEF